METQMKKLLLISSILAGISFNTYAAKLTCKDMIGDWQGSFGNKYTAVHLNLQKGYDRDQLFFHLTLNVTNGSRLDHEDDAICTLAADGTPMLHFRDSGPLWLTLDAHLANTSTLVVDNLDFSTGNGSAAGPLTK
jgi:hypothetical protein